MNTDYILSHIEKIRPIRQYRYKKLIASVLDELKNRHFRYDASDDPEYRRHSQRAMRLARRAMENTMAQAMSLSGSRLNSFAQGIAQQRYNEGIANIDAIIPTLSKMALDSFNANSDVLKRRLTALENQDALEQSEYEKILTAWQKDRAYYLNKRNQEQARLDRLNAIPKPRAKRGSGRKGKKQVKNIAKSLSLKRIIKGQKLA